MVDNIYYNMQICFIHRYILLWMDVYLTTVQLNVVCSIIITISITYYY